MKNHHLTTLLIVLGIHFLFINELSADEAQNNVTSVLAENKLVQLKVIQRRLGENSYELYMQAGDKPEIGFWKSFWGQCKVVISPDGKFVCVSDVQRFGYLSPVLVFRSDDCALLYQTPGRFDHEESAFSYSINKISNESAEINILGNEWNDKSSRPNQRKVFTYKVEFSHLKSIKSNFYNPE